MYHIPLSNLGDAVVEQHVKALTMEPKQRGPSKAVVKYDAFHRTETHLSVPRFYGVAHFGPPREVQLNDGIPFASELAFGGTLQEDQQVAFDRCLAHLRDTPPERGGGGVVLVRRAGGGKTVITLRLALELKRRTLVLVHKSFFLQQWTDRIATFLPGATVGVIRQSKVDVEADFVIAMIQTLTRRDMADVLRTFATVIIDECHHMAAPMFLSVLFKPGLAPRHLIGCSATPERGDGLERLLYFGMGANVDTNQQSDGAEGSAREKVSMRIVRYHGGRRREIRSQGGAGDVILPLMINELVEDPERNALLVDCIAQFYRDGHKVIVLSERIEHLNVMTRELMERCKIPDVDLSIFVGKTPARERARAMERRIIMSTYSMSSEGLDIPSLSAAVLATPRGNVEQSIGRIQRPCAGKLTPVRAVDVVDTFSMFLYMAKKRAKLYRAHGFEVVEEDRSGA